MVSFYTAGRNTGVAIVFMDVSEVVEWLFRLVSNALRDEREN